MPGTRLFWEMSASLGTCDLGPLPEPQLLEHQSWGLDKKPLASLPDLTLDASGKLSSLGPEECWLLEGLSKGQAPPARVPESVEGQHIGCDGQRVSP